jgi:hypothetical protein
MHPQLTLIVAQQHIADLRRAADHGRLVHTATSSHAGPAPATPPPRQSRSCAGSEAAWLKTHPLLRSANSRPAISGAFSWAVEESNLQPWD